MDDEMICRVGGDGAEVERPLRVDWRTKEGQMSLTTISEWVEAGMDRRLLGQSRHLLHRGEGYSLYAYGDVIGPDGESLGHIDDLVDDKALPDSLWEVWGAFVKYWHIREDLDRWDDGSKCVVRLGDQTGQYVIDHESTTITGSFATVATALARIDSLESDRMAL